VRDACLQVTTMAELRPALARAFLDPGEFSAVRRQYADRYSYGRDGKSSFRAAQAVRQLLESGFDAISGRPSLSIITRWVHTPTENEIYRFLDEIERTAQGSDWEVYFLGNRPAGFSGDPRIENWLDTIVPDGLLVNKLAMMCRGEYLVFTSPALFYPLDWPRWMANHFRFNPTAGAVMVLSDRQNYRFVTDQIFPGINFPDSGALTQALLATVMGISIESDSPEAPCVMIPKRKVFDYGGFAPAPLDDAIRQFGKKLREKGNALYQAIDIFCQSYDTRQ
jgi:hypothetical protein